MRTDDLIRETMRILPDLDSLHERLSRDPSQVIRTPVDERRARDTIRHRRNEVKAIVGEPGEVIDEELTKAEDAIIERARRGAKSAVAKVRRDGAKARLDKDDILGLEAVLIWDGRPAIFIQDGHFFPPPERWRRLDDARPEIEAVLESVGVVQVSGHPTLDEVGTAFVAGPNLALTNRHVVKQFATPSADEWRIETGMSARVDFADLFGTTRQITFPVDRIEAVHPSLDLAILHLGARTDEAALPPPLPIAAASFPVSAKQPVYVVGYPAPDVRNENDPGLVQRIFLNIFGVKRLQPGVVLATRPAKFEVTHDCSTLPGNSGSCVVDLATHQVIGLHRHGVFLQENQAIALSKLGSDRVLKTAGIEIAD